MIVSLVNKGFKAGFKSELGLTSDYLDIPTEVFGDTLQKQVEDRLKFYESGDLPPKNAEVMHEAVIKAEEAKKKILKKEKKKKKKSKKSMEVDGENGHEENGRIRFVKRITSTF